MEGVGWDDSGYPDGPFTPDDLNALSGTQPIMARCADGHAAVCNHAALRAAGLEDVVPGSLAHLFERDSAGRPTGRLADLAAVDRVLAHRPSITDAELARLVAGLSDRFLSLGIVGLDDLLADYSTPEPLAVFASARRAGFVPDTRLFPSWDSMRATTLTDAQRSGPHRIAGVKLFLDGVCSAGTAWVDTPYLGSDDHGIRVVEDEALRSAAQWARENGVQVAVHAMGDRAVRHLLELFEGDPPWMGHRPSIRIEHASILSPATVARIGRAGINFGVVTHSVFMFAELPHYTARFGHEQLVDAYPLRRLFSQLPHVALASDAPATAWSDADNPMVTVHAAVNRLTHDGVSFDHGGQRVGVGQALELLTSRPARLSTHRHSGLLRPGEEATFALLDRDIASCPPAELKDVQVLETWIRGEQVWAR